MGVEILTKADLDEFRHKLIKDLENLIAASKPKKWLKTHEVMDILGMSEVTLQTLRNKGVIPFRKLGGICYYNIDELDEAMKKL